MRSGPYPTSDGVGGQSINFQVGQTNSNLVVAPVDGYGQVPMSNHSPGSVEVIADVVGYFSAGPPNRPGYLASLLPHRLLDTRQSESSVPAGGSIDVAVTDVPTVPVEISAAAVDLTVVAPTAGGYLNVFPQGTTRPTSAVNFARLTIANLVVVPVASDGEITIYNGSSQPVNLVVDVSAYVGAVPGVLDWSAPQALTTSEISAISCSSSTFCLAIDQRNAVHRFNGTSWVPAASIPPAQEDGIHVALSCASPTFCVAIADEATAYVWRGTSWTAAATPDGESLNGLSCGSPTFCVGLTGGSEGAGVTTFGGTSWSSSHNVFAERQNLSDVSCVGADFCIVVGPYSYSVGKPLCAGRESDRRTRRRDLDVRVRSQPL